jgi:hypothetical protein
MGAWRVGYNGPHILVQFCHCSRNVIWSAKFRGVKVVHNDVYRLFVARFGRRELSIFFGKLLFARRDSADLSAAIPVRAGHDMDGVSFTTQTRRNGQ